jgi:hypothetical protein
MESPIWITFTTNDFVPNSHDSYWITSLKALVFTWECFGFPSLHSLTTFVVMCFSFKTIFQFTFFFLPNLGHKLTVKVIITML